MKTRKEGDEYGILPLRKEKVPRSKGRRERGTFLVKVKLFFLQGGKDFLKKKKKTVA